VHVIRLQSNDSVAALARIAAADLQKAGAEINENGETIEAQPDLL
jgi:hypothetical protein